MKALIYDQYGIYPDVIENLHFQAGGQDYFIFFTDLNQEEVASLNQINTKMYDLFGDRIAKISLNKKGELVSKAVKGDFVLISLPLQQVQVNDLVKMHQQFVAVFQQESFDVKDVQKLWEERFQFIEKTVAPRLRPDATDYNLILEVLYLSYGLAENAISYLADLHQDHGSKTIVPTLTHLRLTSLDPLSFFNPLNFYLDHSCRDLAELFQSGEIDLVLLERLTEQYQYHTYDASLLMARLLYPSRLFDFFEEIHDKNEVSHHLLKYRQESETELTRLTRAHQMLIRKYQIRPITWLLNR